MAGDLNAHNRLWNCDETDTAGRKLENYCDVNDLDINAPDDYTFLPMFIQGNASTIDLVVSKNTPISELETIFETCSDHNPIIFNIRASLSVQEYTTRPKRDYGRANWRNFREEINRTLHMNRELNNQQQVETEISNITQSTPWKKHFNK